MQQIMLLAIVGAVAAVLGVGALASFDVNSGAIGSGQADVNALADAVTVSYEYNTDAFPEVLADVVINWDTSELTASKNVQLTVVLAGFDDNNNETIIASGSQTINADPNQNPQTVEDISLGNIYPADLEDVDHVHVTILDAP